jgi:spermidine synthase
MLASGFAGLGYQIIWTQQCSSWLGHESAAVLAVVAAFFGGLALGGLTLGSRIERSHRPLFWYVGCELLVALWSLLLLFAAAPFSAWVQRAMGVEPSPGWQWSLGFGCTFVLFLPATAAMGATLPAMERLGTQWQSEGRSIATLYASNTLGAVLGVLVTAFWFLPVLGLTRSAALCIALNLLCGALAFAVFPKSSEPPPRTSPVQRALARGALWRLALSGFLGIGCEVLVVRVLSQVTENTVYTFALLLAVYLAGTALGAAGYQRWLADSRAPEVLSDRLFSALALACAVGMASLSAAESVKAWAFTAFGASVAAALGAEALLAVLAFSLPTLVMGALFSHLCRCASAHGVSFGRALGINTLAAATAPAIVGVLAIPTLGPKLALTLLALGYLAGTTGRAWRTKAVSLPALGVVGIAVLAPALRFVEIPEGGHLVSYEEGALAAVSVIEDTDGVTRLRINNRQQEGSSNSLRVDARQAWLPLLLHPSPKRALFLGLGTGVTASSAATDPTLAVDAVELLPEVIAAARYFTRQSDDSQVAPRLHVVAADARRYVRASELRYDVIVSDNFHPARSGSGALYTVEHFEAVRRRLQRAGVFCQWLPLHQLDLETLRSIVRSFLAVYPRAWAMIASNSLETPVLGLIGRGDESRFDAVALRERLSHLAPPEWVARLGLEDEYALFGSIVAGPAALERFAGSAAANTDDYPVVAYRAPLVTYAPDSSPGDRLVTLLQQLSLEPVELFRATPDASWERRLAAYWLARDRFIESGRNVRPSANVQDMLAQVREPLLSVLRISPDFRPAYDPLISMASALVRLDVSSARSLLTELTRIQPTRSEAPRLLEQLSAGASSIGAVR